MTKKKTLSKKETFGSIIEKLEKAYPEGIPKELMLDKLVESGKFSKMESRDYLDKLHITGFMYEPKLGYLSIVC